MEVIELGFGGERTVEVSVEGALEWIDEFRVLAEIY
jgi:hypothetical protein